MRTPAVVDIFCGVGGISRGFKNAGFDVVLGVDSNEYAAKIFKKHFPESDVLVEDVKKIKGSDILEKIKIKKVDVLVGGPPCQGFSVARRRNPKDDRNKLFLEFARLAKELMPSWILIENVFGLASAKMEDGSNALDCIYEVLAPEFRLKHFFINAADLGIPQNRKRIIFVGNSLGIDFDLKLFAKNWKPVGELLSRRSEVDKKYFCSKKKIDGFKRREKKNKAQGLGFHWQFLKMNQPSYTIPARYGKDGSNALIKYSESDIRMLTESECAKIQGLNPKLFNSGKKAYMAIGNAAPPKMVEPFARKIFEYGMQ